MSAWHTSVRALRQLISAGAIAVVLAAGSGLEARAQEQVPEPLPESEEVPETDVPAAEPEPATEVEPERPNQRQAQPKRRVQLDLSDRRIYIYEDDKTLASYPVAIGKPGWETPTGNFRILSMERDPYWRNPWTGEVLEPEQSPIGRAVIVFHELPDSDQRFLTGSSVAFHGTANEELIGQAVSHGCVRMRNADIIAMYEMVGIGTPVIVVD